LSANTKPYMPRRFAQQLMTCSEWPFYVSRAISAVAELPVFTSMVVASILQICTLLLPTETRCHVLNSY